MRVVFMGTPDFAAVSLSKLIDEGYEVELVVTQPDRASKRGGKVSFSPVKTLAMEFDIPVFQPEKIRNDEELFLRLSRINPDVIVVAAYGQIIPKRILDLPTYGCVNVHGSLLPELRGAAPIQYAILRGYEETGVTIMQMDEGLDTGDMLSKVSVPIERMNSEELYDVLAEKGAELLVRTLDDMKQGRLKAEKQKDEEATYSEIIKKADGHIDFTKESAVFADRKIRAYTPWPGAFTVYKGQNMKIKEAYPCEEYCDGEKAGTVIKVSDEGIFVACSSGILCIKVLQMPGKKAMPVAAFIRGNKVEVGDVFF